MTWPRSILDPAPAVVVLAAEARPPHGLAVLVAGPTTGVDRRIAAQGVRAAVLGATPTVAETTRALSLLVSMAPRVCLNCAREGLTGSPDLIFTVARILDALLSGLWYPYPAAQEEFSPTDDEFSPIHMDSAQMRGSAT